MLEFSYRSFSLNVLLSFGKLEENKDRKKTLEDYQKLTLYPRFQRVRVDKYLSLKNNQFSRILIETNVSKSHFPRQCLIHLLLECHFRNQLLL